MTTTAPNTIPPAELKTSTMQKATPSQLAFLRKVGVVHELNRLLLHPLGLALAFDCDTKDAAGNPLPEPLPNGEVRLLVDTSDPCGIVFADPSWEKAEAFARLVLQTFARRRAAGLEHVQPLGTGHADVDTSAAIAFAFALPGFFDTEGNVVDSTGAVGIDNRVSALVAAGMPVEPTTAEKAAAVKAPVFFHGVNKAIGHYWHGPRDSYIGHRDVVTPWGGIDGVLAPRKGSGLGYADDGSEFEQGQAALHHANGWTALAFWDRSGADKRDACNSVFVVQAEVDFDTMVALVKREHPTIFARFPWPIVDVGPVVVVADRQGRRSTRLKPFVPATSAAVPR